MSEERQTAAEGAAATAALLLNPLDTLERAVSSAAQTLPKVRAGGIVTEVTQSYCRVSGLSQLVSLGECVMLTGEGSSQLGEVIRIDANGATVKPFDGINRVGLGATAWRHGFVSISPHASWKGRILNALALPIDGRGSLPQGTAAVATDRPPPPPMRRGRVKIPVRTGVRIVDIFTPLCAGQRIGIFAGSGIGKSTLLAMLTRAQGFDTVVIALVGERGREVREFVEDVLGAERGRVVAVVATGDESAMMRRLAPKTALTIAEHFRDGGENVLLILDSVTRFAHAAREVALAAGEPPVARGYPPSVFNDLPKLLERAGPGEEGSGSITGVFSVLVDGDDPNDPVADSIRGTLDGHIILDRAIADLGRFPAVNVLGSVSRLAQNVWSADQARLVAKFRTMIARYEDTRDLRLMGGYQRGADAELDKAVDFVPKLYEALRQTPQEAPSADVFQDIARILSA
ncbi:MAG TPA: flagellar protein export ATPase FliI [Hyphomicrobiaceae bacterium]|nr:flagellar protein export ATPase FliI [Hyphomicrobiaceae bacterium]